MLSHKRKLFKSPPALVPEPDFTVNWAARGVSTLVDEQKVADGGLVWRKVRHNLLQVEAAFVHYPGTSSQPWGKHAFGLAVFLPRGKLLIRMLFTYAVHNTHPGTPSAGALAEYLGRVCVGGDHFQQFGPEARAHDEHWRRLQNNLVRSRLRWGRGARGADENYCEVAGVRAARRWGEAEVRSVRWSIGCPFNTPRFNLCWDLVYM